MRWWMERGSTLPDWMQCPECEHPLVPGVPFPYCEECGWPEA
jgi:hypothetical protein